MTEAEWLTTDTRPMALCRHIERKASARKLRLLACAGCGLVADRITAPAARSMVAVTARYAEGSATEAEFVGARAELAAVLSAGSPICHRERAEWVPFAGLNATSAAAYPEIASGLRICLRWVEECALRGRPNDGSARGQTAFRRRLCDLIRDIVGNPYRPWKPVPDWLGGGLVQPVGTTVRLTATAVGLAEAIHAGQAFDRLPVLADALEEAGIADRELLDHCREGVGHVRGCWAVDVVLGKT